MVGQARQDVVGAGVVNHHRPPVPQQIHAAQAVIRHRERGQAGVDFRLQIVDHLVDQPVVLVIGQPQAGPIGVRKSWPLFRR